ncbi:uncharacterized protein LOC129616902 [Condylostylus longicornis]|uniref:uncharacterized protein LOC129616902 n=1 Tax=Condylostylus longicornis TaxID=2530218 RepID=UPI00244DF363|nr:uncharacterized protein LOC129616902 [Condylostylus longicornis]
MLTTAASKERESYAQAGSVAEEVLGSIRTVTAFGAEEKARSRYEEHLDDSLSSGVRGGIFTGLGIGMTMGFLFLSYALGFWFGGKLIADDKESGCTGDDCFNAGKTLTVFFCVVNAAFAIGQFASPFTSFVKGVTAADELLELVDKKSSIDPTEPTGMKGTEIRGDVVFKNVHFHYPSRPENQIFNGINLHIPAGKTVALVGGSGCGKSTIIQMVQRFYDPDEGEILIDGVAVKDYNTAWIRDQMSLVSQEPRLFARSIAENIRDGRLGATIDEVQSAAKNANAWSFISEFPEKFDTFVGEGGSQLSGGQKQRIAIARAMLRDPAILILDEATSALDNESEKIVQSTLDALVAARKRTTIVIAHRLTTIRNADLIIVLDNSNGNGAVVAEQGRHDELMAIPNGIYQNLVNTQKLHGVVQTNTRKLSRDSSMQSDIQLDVQKKLSHLLRRPSSAASELRTVQQEEPAKGTKPPRPPGLLRVLGLLKPHWFPMACGILGSMACGVVFPVFALIYSEFLPVYFLEDPNEIRKESSFWSLMFIAIAGGSLFAYIFEKSFMEWSGQHLIRDLRALTFDRMVYQDMSYFDDPKHSTGTLSQILSSDVLLVKGWGGDNMGLMIQNVTSLACGVIIAFTANAKLAAVALASFALLVPASAMHMKFLAGSGDEITEGSQAIFAIMMSAMGIGQSMVFATDAKKAKDAASRVYAVIDRAPLIDSRSTRGKELLPSDIHGDIVVENVNFRYPMRPDVPIFSKITFRIKPGETVALVGASGCGKSTVIQLLERFYDAKSTSDPTSSSGVLKLDGLDIQDIRVKSLRNAMGLVSQEPILFNTSIIENIRYGKADASEEEVIEAARMANAHDFIAAFPDGYNTIVGKFGGQLSGGQKQRIAIARAMIRNPKILLLDEATSALDAESEKIVQAALDRLLAESKRTTIVIAHRLSTIQNADKIVVLANPDREGSSVVEVGTHAELMGIRDGVYRSLVNIATATDRK